MLLNGGINIDGSQADQYVRIEFTGEGMVPLKRVNLNQNNYYIKHSVFGDPDPKLER